METMKSDLINCTCICPEVANWWNDVEKFGFKTEVRSESLWERLSNFCIRDPFGHVSEASTLTANEQDIIKEGYVLGGRWKRQRRRGRGSLSGPALEERGIQMVHGNYVDGWLQGKGKAILTNGITLEGEFEAGRLQGPVRGFDEVGRMVMVGYFHGGAAVAPFWKKIEGDGYLYGDVDESGGLTGDANAYIYSDLSTAIVGSYHSDYLKHGKASKIQSLRHTRQIVTLSFAQPNSDQVYRYWPSTLTEIRVPPLLTDPLESQLVEVRQSRMNDEAGDGLFSISSIPKGATVAFYNGIRVKPGQEPEFRSIHYEIYVDWQPKNRQVSDYMDLPDDFIATDKYRATLGHKINHSFRPNCKWDTCQHPVFGRIPRIVTLKDIQPGQELSCHYMIDLNEACQKEEMTWYMKAWEEESKLEAK